MFDFVDDLALVLPARQVSEELDCEAAKTMEEWQPRNLLDE